MHTLGPRFRARYGAGLIDGLGEHGLRCQPNARYRDADEHCCKKLFHGTLQDRGCSHDIAGGELYRDGDHGSDGA